MRKKGVVTVIARIWYDGCCQEILEALYTGVTRTQAQHYMRQKAEEYCKSMYYNNGITATYTVHLSKEE